MKHATTSTLDALSVLSMEPHYIGAPIAWTPTSCVLRAFCAHMQHLLFIVFRYFFVIFVSILLDLCFLVAVDGSILGKFVPEGLGVAYSAQSFFRRTVPQASQSYQGLYHHRCRRNTPRCSRFLRLSSRAPAYNSTPARRVIPSHN